MSRGVLRNVVRLRVIGKPRKRGSPDPLGAFAPWGERITGHSEILPQNGSLRRLTEITPSLSKPKHFVKKYLTPHFISARRRISEMQRINIGLLLLVILSLISNQSTRYSMR